MPDDLKINFIFNDEIPGDIIPNSIVLEIQRDVISKRDLLAIFLEGLKFPYFGNNWDSLEDCLEDLSWLDEDKIIIFHYDVPLEDGSRDQFIYLDIIRIRTSENDEYEKKMYIIFPTECEEKIYSLLGADK